MKERNGRLRIRGGTCMPTFANMVACVIPTIYVTWQAIVMLYLWDSKELPITINRNSYGSSTEFIGSAGVLYNGTLIFVYCVLSINITNPDYWKAIRKFWPSSLYIERQIQILVLLGAHCVLCYIYQPIPDRLLKITSSGLMAAQFALGIFFVFLVAYINHYNVNPFTNFYGS
jgi:hypothetical protein